MDRNTIKRTAWGAAVALGLVALIWFTPYGRHEEVNRIRRATSFYDVPLPTRETRLSETTIISFDTETTGVNPNYDRLLELGAAKYREGQLVEERNWMIDPGRFVPMSAQDIHGITPDDLVGARSFEEIYPEVAEFMAGALLIAHNANFDVSFLRAEILRAGYPLPSNSTIDTMQYFRRMLPDLPSYRLQIVADKLGIEGGTFHRALDDAKYTAEIFFVLSERLGPDATLSEVFEHAGNLVPFIVP